MLNSFQYKDSALHLSIIKTPDFNWSFYLDQNTSTYAGVTFVAFKPFGDSVTSKVTGSPSLS